MQLFNALIIKKKDHPQLYWLATRKPACGALLIQALSDSITPSARAGSIQYFQKKEQGS
jgi:hypothetical protein